MKNLISFPGLGIKEFAVNEKISIFGLDVAWYGIIITCGIILAVTYVLYRSSKFERVSQDDILDCALVCIPTAIVGARAYYVLTSLDQYDSFSEAIAIWNGGLAIYGAVIGGALALLVMSLIKKISIFKIFDLACPAVMIGQIIGRWGNFVNAEAHGGITDSILRMGLRTEGTLAVYVHPTFLYESVWNLIGFLLINAYYPKKKYHGEIFFMYISWYGLGRFFIEGLRTDSLYVGNFRISQVIGLLSFLVGLAFLIVFYFKKARGRIPLFEVENAVEVSFGLESLETVEENKVEAVEDTEDTEDITEEKEIQENGKDN